MSAVVALSQDELSAYRYGPTVNPSGLRNKCLRNAIFAGLIDYHKRKGYTQTQLRELLDTAHRIGRETSQEYFWNALKGRPSDNMATIESGRHQRDTLIRGESGLISNDKFKRETIPRQELNGTTTQRIMLLLVQLAEEFTVNLRINQIIDFIDGQPIASLKPKRDYAAEFYPEKGPAPDTIEIAWEGIHFYWAIKVSEGFPDQPEMEEWITEARKKQKLYDQEWDRLIKASDEKMIRDMEEEAGKLKALELDREQRKTEALSLDQIVPGFSWKSRTKIDPQFDWDKDWDEWHRNNPEPSIDPWDWSQDDWEAWLAANPEPADSSPTQSDEQLENDRAIAQALEDE